MSIGRTTEYRNTSHRHKNCGGPVECRTQRCIHYQTPIACKGHSNGGAEDANGSGVWGGGIPLSGGGGALGPEKIFDFVLLSVELLCILDSGAGRYSTSTVIMNDVTFVFSDA